MLVLAQLRDGDEGQIADDGAGRADDRGADGAQRDDLQIGDAIGAGQHPIEGRILFALVAREQGVQDGAGALEQLANHRRQASDQLGRAVFFEASDADVLRIREQLDDGFTSRGSVLRILC